LFVDEILGPFGAFLSMLDVGFDVVVIVFTISGLSVDVLPVTVLDESKCSCRRCCWSSDGLKVVDVVVGVSTRVELVVVVDEDAVILQAAKASNTTSEAAMQVRFKLTSLSFILMGLLAVVGVRFECAIVPLFGLQLRGDNSPLSTN
jgi:hypothetical protein